MGDQRLIQLAKDEAVGIGVQWAHVCKLVIEERTRHHRAMESLLQEQKRVFADLQEATQRVDRLVREEWDVTDIEEKT